MLALIKKILPQPIKNGYHLIQALAANLAFGFPSRRLLVIGVTGTNGKTTTCQMIERIFFLSGQKTALASTINFKLGDREWVNKTKFTTLSAWEIQKFLSQAAREKCQVAVLETSSHSLDQHRVWGINYAVAVITNITREHLDYHKNMREYKNSKLKLFKTASAGVVNLKMKWAEEFLGQIKGKKWGYVWEGGGTSLSTLDSKRTGDYQTVKAEKIVLRPDGSDFLIQGESFHLQLPGIFNLENALAAVSAALSQGIELKTASRALAQLEKVPGRLDQVENNLGLKIIIDYAVTPDSMEKLGGWAESLKTAGQRIIWVFGACGQRDRGKRPLMGELGARYADRVIITNEDPYGEDPQAILDAVFSGVLKSEKMREGENCWRIMDRREAIARALTLAEKGDLILITGKGAEETMAIGEKERIDWSDRRVIEEELKKISV